MPYGYTGNILQVDLSNQKIEVEEKDEAFYRSYLGGRGIGYHYLMQEVPVQTDPFSPENILVLATGVMTGAPLPAACRFAAVGKSPLTGTAGESEAAGFFGPELKMAGFDAIVFKGRAEKPVYLRVTEKKAEIQDATHLAELGAREVEDAIRDEIGSKKVRVAQTGLAGMNQVRFANITNNLSNFNGRCGFGALMGSKNVRAVAALGSEKIEFQDPEFLRETAQHYAATFKNNPVGEALYVYGTTAFPEILSAAGALPVDNFRPKYGVDSRYGGPEYETISALGTNLKIIDLKAIAKGNEICNRYCLDTISTGMTIAFACECFQEGIISKADTDGLELRFGDADLMIQLLEMIARREGVGDLLAEGVARLAKKWQVEDAICNLAVKGQEISMHDPRVKVGVGVDEKSFALNAVKPLGIYKPMPATEITAEKVRNYKILENFWRTLDALGLCVFGYAPRGVMPIDTMVRCLNAITGWEASLFELMRAGERGTMIARAFNSREGFSANNDRLPQRLFDPKPDGANAGKNIFKEEDFNEAIRLYYDMIGCDPETGRPHRGKLLELGLEWVEASLNV
jgi:aldehyde:ferredoxin oxidoreductase